MRCNVAGLLKIQAVQPRAIAYVAVQVGFLFCIWCIHLMVEFQLCFALSSCTFWTVRDNNFNYETFYHNIVNWFELPASVARSREIERLLCWWNRQAKNLANIEDYLHCRIRLIFGHCYASTLEPQDVMVLSIALSMA